MNTDDHPIDHLITNESFINWVLHPQNETNTYWEQYLKNNHEESEEIEAAIALVKKMNAAKTLPSSDQKIKILESIHSGIKSKSYAKPKIINWMMIGKIAATFAIIVTGSYLFSINGDNEFKTDYTEIQNITLPDGSQVVLNSNSSLEFKNDWNNTADREVWLQGEAYFKVSKAETQKSKKFVVHTDDLNVTVLGTQFNVNTHKEETTVVLEEGKIDISITKANHPISKETITMIPGQKTSFNPNAKDYQVSKVNTAVYTSWKDGTITFDGTPLTELKVLIESSYGYKVTFANEALLSKKLDGKIDNPDLETLLTTLETIFNLNIEKNGKNIIIKE